MLKWPHYKNVAMTSIIHTEVTEFTETCSLLDDLGGWGVSNFWILWYVSGCRASELHSSILSWKVFSHPEMEIHQCRTGSDCRCRRNVPLACHKPPHPPPPPAEEWQEALTTGSHSHSRLSARLQITQECFNLITLKDIMQMRQIKILLVSHFSIWSCWRKHIPK